MLFLRELTGFVEHQEGFGGEGGDVNEALGLHHHAAYLGVWIEEKFSINCWLIDDFFFIFKKKFKI